MFKVQTHLPASLLEAAEHNALSLIMNGRDSGCLLKIATPFLLVRTFLVSVNCDVLVFSLGGSTRVFGLSVVRLLILL